MNPSITSSESTAHIASAALTSGRRSQRSDAGTFKSVYNRPALFLPATQVQNRKYATIASVVLLSLFIQTGCGSTHSDTHQQGIAIRLAVTRGVLHHLPVYLAESLGHYQEEGLNVTLHEFAGGSKVMESLLGGSADVGSGAYEQTIQLAAQGQRVRAFTTVFHGGGMALVAFSHGKQKLHAISDLKGATVGVSAPGSPSHLFASYLAVRHGLVPADITAVGIGGGASAVSAIERGVVDVAVTGVNELVVLRKRHPELSVLADATTRSGAREVFGVENYPSHVLYARPEWLDRNAEAAHRLARAIKRTLAWIREHSADDVRQQLPQAMRLNDAASDRVAIESAIPMFSEDGLMTPEGAEAVRRVLAVSNQRVRDTPIDLSQTYTNEFVRN